MSAVLTEHMYIKTAVFAFEKNAFLDGVFINSENKTFGNDIYIFRFRCVQYIFVSRVFFLRKRF